MGLFDFFKKAKPAPTNPTPVAGQTPEIGAPQMGPDITGPTDLTPPVDSTPMGGPTPPQVSPTPPIGGVPNPTPGVPSNNFPGQGPTQPPQQ